MNCCMMLAGCVMQRMEREGEVRRGSWRREGEREKSLKNKR